MRHPSGRGKSLRDGVLVARPGLRYFFQSISLLQNDAGFTPPNASMLPQLQLEQLRCPVTGGTLAWLADDRLQQLRRAIDEQWIVNRAGDLVTEMPDAALVCTNESLAYPVRNGIPALVPGVAIELGQLPDVVTHKRGEHG